MLFAICYALPASDCVRSPRGASASSLRRAGRAGSFFPRCSLVEIEGDVGRIFFRVGTASSDSRLPSVFVRYAQRAGPAQGVSFGVVPDALEVAATAALVSTPSSATGTAPAPPRSTSFFFVAMDVLSPGRRVAPGYITPPVVGAVPGHAPSNLARKRCSMPHLSLERLGHLPVGLEDLHDA